MVISSLCCLEADDKLSMSPDAGSGDQLPMCIGGADDKLSMSLAAGDQLPICLGDADDNLSISLAAGGSGDRFSFLINRMPQRSIRSLYFGVVTASVIADTEDFSETLARIYQATRGHISEDCTLRVCRCQQKKHLYLRVVVLNTATPFQPFCKLMYFFFRN